MKSKFIAYILSLFIFIVGLCPMVSMGQVPSTPTIGGDVTPAGVYNQLNPMPAELGVLHSVEELKADVLRRVKSGILRIHGPHISEVANYGYLRVEGSSPQDILIKMSEANLRVWMPDPTKSVTVTAELIDDEGYSVAQGYAEATPVRLIDGSYVIESDVKIELHDWQEIRGITGDIESATITNIDEYGNTNTQRLHVWNNRFTVSMSMLDKKGYLMVVRREPTGNGGTRNVAYGYDLLTGKSHLLTQATWKMLFSVNNYYEANDNETPLYLNGSPVSILADMRIAKKMEPNGTFRSESQPVVRLEVTVPGRKVKIWTGLHDEKTGRVQDYGHSLRVKNALTSEVKPIPSQNGYGEVVLGVGSYDLMYHLDSFDILINPRG